MAIQWPLLIFSVFLGISSGMMIFVGIGEIKGRFKEVRVAAAVIALVLLIAGGCASALHLGHPERALHILGNAGSGLSRELFAVGAMAIVTFVYAIVAKKEFDGAAKVFGGIALVVGVVLPLVAGASYLMAARPVWDSPALPVMYLGTGLGMGFAAMACLVLAKGSREDASFATKLALFGVAAMVLSALAYIAWIALAPHQADSRSIMRLVSGDLALCFWLGVVVLEIVAPVALAFMAHKGASDVRRAATYMGAAFACSLAGGVALRAIMYLMATSVESFIY